MSYRPRVTFTSVRVEVSTHILDVSISLALSTLYLPTPRRGVPNHAARAASDEPTIRDVLEIFGLVRFLFERSPVPIRIPLERFLASTLDTDADVEPLKKIRARFVVVSNVLMVDGLSASATMVFLHALLSTRCGR
jgi:hypothetical protein